MSTPRTATTTKILLALPVTLKNYLEALKRFEGVTASAYLRKLIEDDRRCRLEEGWRDRDGWAQLRDPAYQAKEQAATRRAGPAIDQVILRAARRIQQRTARPKKGGRHDRR